MFSFEGLFDINRDGKLDAMERGMEFAFLDSMSKDRDYDDYDDDDHDDDDDENENEDWYWYK